MLDERMKYDESDYFYSVKFIKQKKRKIVKEDQQRHKIYENFHSAIFKMEIRKDNTLSSIQDMIM